MDLHDLVHNKCIICAFPTNSDATFCYCPGLGSYYNSHFIFGDHRMRLTFNDCFIYINFLIKNILVKSKNKRTINLGNVFHINEFDLKNLEYEEQRLKIQKVENKLKILITKYNKNYMLYE